MVGSVVLALLIAGWGWAGGIVLTLKLTRSSRLRTFYRRCRLSCIKASLCAIIDSSIYSFYIHFRIVRNHKLSTEVEREADQL